MTKNERVDKLLHIRGFGAIAYAEDWGLTLHKAADATSGPRYGLSVGEAIEMAKVAPSLIYVRCQYVEITILDDVELYDVFGFPDRVLPRGTYLVMIPSDYDPAVIPAKDMLTDGAIKIVGKV